MTGLHRIIVFVVLSCPLAVFAAAPNTAQAESKVTICHIPPGDPTDAETIVVGSASLPAHLAHGDTLGACAPTCQSNGGACTSSTDCCSGNCQNSQCAPPCTSDGGACETGTDCCSGICTGTNKTCASECTLGPEALGPYCERYGLDCCEGVCFFGACWVGFSCLQTGDSCPAEPPTMNELCCFGDTCDQGQCALCTLPGAACDSSGINTCCDKSNCIDGACCIEVDVEAPCDPQGPNLCCSGGVCSSDAGSPARGPVCVTPTP